MLPIPCSCHVAADRARRVALPAMRAVVGEG
jgi:hypothetical protein